MTARNKEVTKAIRYDRALKWIKKQKAGKNAGLFILARPVGSRIAGTGQRLPQ